MPFTEFLFTDQSFSKLETTKTLFDLQESSIGKGGINLVTAGKKTTPLLTTPAVVFKYFNAFHEGMLGKFDTETSRVKAKFEVTMSLQTPDTEGVRLNEGKSAEELRTDVDNFVVNARTILEAYAHLIWDAKPKSFEDPIKKAFEHGRDRVAELMNMDEVDVMDSTKPEVVAALDEHACKAFLKNATFSVPHIKYYDVDTDEVLDRFQKSMGDKQFKFKASRQVYKRAKYGIKNKEMDALVPGSNTIPASPENEQAIQQAILGNLHYSPTDIQYATGDKLKNPTMEVTDEEGKMHTVPVIYTYPADVKSKDHPNYVGALEVDESKNFIGKLNLLPSATAVDDKVYFNYKMTKTVIILDAIEKRNGGPKVNENAVLPSFVKKRAREEPSEAEPSEAEPEPKQVKLEMESTQVPSESEDSSSGA